MEKEAQIICPNCGSTLNVSDILYKQLEEELRKKFSSQLSEEKQKYETKVDELKKQEEAFENDKKQFNDKLQEKLDERLKVEKSELEKKIKKKIEEEEAEKVADLQKELNEKSEKIKEMNKLTAENAKLKREKDELQTSLEADLETKLNTKLQEEKEKIKAAGDLKIEELKKQLADQVELTKEMAKKQEQGSMQLQGEVQELAIEDWLRSNFPYDTIDEIRKGVRGADCIQTVNTQNRTGCGKIYYESKRAKEFGCDWIEKFKADMRERSISTGILVTQVMPKGMDRMGVRDGVWICNYSEFKGLSTLMRESVIMISDITAGQENKGEKMEMLYAFLISPEFKSQIEAIVEGFTQMRNDLSRERIAMEKLWKAREKQIDKVLLNTTHMYASIKGIAGNAISTVQALELGDGVSPDETEANKEDESN